MLKKMRRIGIAIDVKGSRLAARGWVREGGDWAEAKAALATAPAVVLPVTDAGVPPARIAWALRVTMVGAMNKLIALGMPLAQGGEFCFALVAQVLGMLQRHVEEIPQRHRGLEVQPIGDGVQRDTPGQPVAGEGVRRVAVHVPGELIEQDNQC